MRICKHKITGKLLEAQSNATPGTLLTNQSKLYPLTDIEESVVTDAEFKVLLATTRDSELTYIDRRLAEYPSIEERLRDIYVNGGFSVNMRTKIKAIDDKYPKPL